MKIELNVIMPTGFSYFWTYQGVTLSMGRDPACEMAVDDTAPRSVSRRHARIECDKNGTLSVRDLQSRNGTYVNGQRISGAVPLRLGDQIRLGRKGPRLIVLKFVPDGKVKHVACPPPLPAPKPRENDAAPRDCPDCRVSTNGIVPLDAAVSVAAKHRVRLGVGQWLVAMAGTSAVMVLTMLVSILWLTGPPSAPPPAAATALVQTEEPVCVDVLLTCLGFNPGGHDRADQ
jgi:pSer/pThr/pTyr-binding forkhead associated (FHA) protein